VLRRDLKFYSPPTLALSPQYSISSYQIVRD
jgi:hypothetical protein